MHHVELLILLLPLFCFTICERKLLLVTLTPASSNVSITVSSSLLLLLSRRPTSSTASRLDLCSCSAIRFSIAIILVVRLSHGLYFSLSNSNSFSSSFISFIFFLALVMFSLYWARSCDASWLLLVNRFCSFYRFSFYFLGGLLKWLTFLYFLNVYSY